MFHFDYVHRTVLDMRLPWKLFVLLIVFSFKSLGIFILFNVLCFKFLQNYLGLKAQNYLQNVFESLYV